MNSPILTSLRLPIVAAPMFLVSGPDLVVSACQSGVIGSFPTQNCRTLDDLDSWMGSITDRLGIGANGSTNPAPWAANLVTHSSNQRLADDLRLIAEYKPKLVITALGSPKPVMDVVKGYGGIVIADVVNMTLAHKAADAGVDGMACVSAGAGGHTGHLSPFAFTSAVREFFDGMIIIGGGISDGFGVAGAITAGADLVYMGTRFLAAEESMAQQAYKQMIVDSGPDDLVVSASVTGTPASWLKPSLIAAGLDPDNLAPLTVEKNYTAGGGSLKRWKDVWAAGQGLQTIHAVEPVSKIVDQIAAEYGTALQRISDGRPVSAGV
ncbi:MAG: nitronate monooxygenase [Rhodococcus sp. (in: high G+C Gram-positive bacteria)]|uniref:NAD(P)H-dependent flavin oxidoreductase n=1 Tax=Rhodococcus TaxID=1827 RepID=UPI001E49A093|nr:MULTISPECIES: nitronate monooxygenase [Rhodococcus erythropolis group]MCD2104397.1 nitronate monooxygenase [Rhodococcus qingshengii]MCZ4523452.1 nitronate monooxygenase [Rhodococcus erythropolis]MDZ7917471.1 nitronate monooxygenase [Rhodococcus sp. (in: high G+C Gram-positive bacteria)]